MAKKFTNKDPKVDASEVRECGTEDVEFSDIEGVEEVILRALANNDIVERAKNSRTGPPYVEYEEADLIYLPIVFNLVENSETGVQYHKGKQFYINLVAVINEVLAGTYIPSNFALGDALSHVDHGVASKLRFKLPQKLPVNYIKNFNCALANPLLTNREDMFELNCSAAADCVDPWVEYNDSDILNDIDDQAQEDLATAQTAYDAYELELQTSGGYSPAEVQETLTNSSLYIDLKRAKDIADFGGFVDCGPEGAIFIEDISKLKGSTLAAVSTKRGFRHATGVYRDQSGLWRTTMNGSPGGRFHDRHSYLIYNTGHAGRVLPVLRVSDLKGEGSAYGLVDFAGKCPLPVSTSTDTHSYEHHGMLQMSLTSSGYMSTFIHELGHFIGLPHSFEGNLGIHRSNPILPIVPGEVMSLSSDDKNYVQGLYNFLHDFINSDDSITVSFQTVDDGDITRKIIASPGTASQTLENQYSYIHQTVANGTFWDGSTSEAEFNTDGTPKLVMNKATYTEVAADNIEVDLSTLSFTNATHGADFSSFVNPSRGSSGNGGVGFILANLGAIGDITSIVIEVGLNASTTLHIEDNSGNSLHSGVILGASYPYAVEAITLTTGITDISSLNLTMQASGTMRIFSITVTTVDTTLAIREIEHITRIPFCTLVDGIPSDVYDDFWYLNVNWINNDFPPYPDNTPTDALYDQEFCPCLHVPQHYRDPAGEDFNVTFYPYYSGGGYNQTYSAAAIPMPSLYSRSVVSAISFASAGLPNGKAPGFGYYGFDPFTPPPKNLADTMHPSFSGEAYTSNSYAPSDIITTAYKWALSPHYYARIFIGDSDINSPYYNPYKVQTSLDPSTITSYLRGEIAGGDIYGSNVNGFEVSYPSIGDPMGYNAAVYIPVMGEGADTSAAPIGPIYPESTRVAYSPGQLSIMESIVEEGSVNFRRMLRFAELIDLKNAAYGEDLFTPIYNDLVDSVENEDISGMIGCRNPAAINYNADAIVGDYRTCILPGEDCTLPTHIIYICNDDSILLCGDVIPSEEYLEYFEGESTESVILSSEDYPVYEGCEGGGFKYVLDSSVCEYGTLSSEGCLIGEGSSQEDLLEAVASSGVEYTLNCGEDVRGLLSEGRVTIFPDLYTLGGIYFSSKGEYYSGPYVYRSGGIVWAGNVGATLFRLYTSEQLRSIDIAIPTISTEAKKFAERKEDIENIVDLQNLKLRGNE